MVSQPSMTISSQRPVAPIAFHSGAAHSSLTFVGAIASRYLDRHAARASTDFVWQRMQLNYAQINRSRFASRISITVNPTQYRELRESTNTQTTLRQLVTHDRHSIEQPIALTMLEPRTHEAVTSVIERVVSRTIRRNATDPRQPIAEPVAPQSPVAHPTQPERRPIADLQVRPVAREQSGRPTEFAGPEPLVMAEISPRRTRHDSINHTSQQTEIDINALTERVVHAIDRRVMAQRERLGRS